MKKPWNIWDIKNRWLRATVAWPLFIGMAVVFVAVLPIATVQFALKGAWEAVADGYTDGFRGWRPIMKASWAAMTAQDAL